ncbi:MAG TPA: VOC family protein [Gemmatimonadaceae bacterium]|nr:VOC family protein [Gemmatimonadaceae bacterium]
MTTSLRRETEVRIRSAVPTFLVADIAATARWYVKELGFTLRGHAPQEEPYAYASLVRDAAELMLLNLPDYQKPDLSARRPSGLWDAYFRMNGVAALYETVKGKPFLKMELTRQPYGDLEFEVRDPNGYILVFGGE